MTANTPIHSPQTRGRRKLAALLAGGLVASVGVISTLASWNDSEFAGATFTAGHFDLEGSTDGGLTYAQHPTVDEPGVLTFEAPAENLSPGDWAGGEFTVRLAKGTTHNALVRVEGAGTTGALTGVAVYLWRDLEGSCAGKPYDVDNSMGFSMDGATYRGPKVGLSKGATVDEAGEELTLCFAVSGGDRLPQGQTGSYLWKLSAESVAD
nr:SipW-dependent-type signal peptide-containing protein [Propionicimonas sp.]